MLHDVALEVFSCSWTGGAVGNGVTGGFRSIPKAERAGLGRERRSVLFPRGAGRFGKGAASGHFSRAGRPGARITEDKRLAWSLEIVSHISQYFSLPQHVIVIVSLFAELPI